MRKKLLIFQALAFSGLLLLGSCGSDENTISENTTDSRNTFTFIHMNDIHSHLDESSYSLYFNGTKTYVELGGVPRAVTKIKEISSSSPNPIILNAGDMVQGTLYYILSKGNATAELLNLINWDAVTIGNHEFDDGNEGLKNFFDKLNATVVSANIVPEEGSILEGYWKPYKIVERNGEKVGIIGIGYAQKTEDSSNPGDDINFYDEIEKAKEYIEELKDQGINKIVIVSHFGMENDINLAKELEDVDVIIDGDTHSLLGNYTDYGLSTSYNSYPVTIEKEDGSKVCIASAWQYSYAVGKLQVKFDDNGKVVECSGNDILLLGDTFKRKDEGGNYYTLEDSEKEEVLKLISESNGKLEVVAPDTTAESILKKYTEEVNELNNKTIGEAAEFLGHNRIPGDMWDGTSILSEHGSDIAPLVAKSFYEKVKDADLAIQNAGGVRTPIDEGNITVGEVYELLPFSNTLYTLEMTGKEIKQVLEDAISNFEDNGGSTGSFPYAYGIKFEVDLSEPQNNRISNLQILDGNNGTWTAIDNDTLYKVVTNSYIAAGKDGYTTFGEVLAERGGVDTYFEYAGTFVEMIENLTAEGKKLEKLPVDETPIQKFTGDFLKLLTTLPGTESSSEINTFDPETQRLFITNGANNTIDIYDISNATSAKLVKSVSIEEYGNGINSVAVKNGKVAVAVEVTNATDDSKQEKGKVVILDTDGNLEKEITVGYLPDMVTFTEDGSKIIVANEGEPNDNYDYDPEGSIGIIDLPSYEYTELTFENIALTPAEDGTPVRLGGTPSNNATKDIEPEYITTIGNYAYVTLQENNAIAKVNLTTKEIELVKSLGTKSYTPGNHTIDIEENGKIEMKNFPELYALYQPDGIASVSINGTTYLITANEGDGRDYDGYSDESKISKLRLNSSIADAYEEDNDLKVMTDLGDTDNDGEYEKLYAFGGRSFAIWDENGTLIWDSGDELSKIVKEKEPELFNHDEGEMDGRSGNKGVEPEGIVIGEIDGKTYAFIALERQCSIVVYDITNPQNPQFVYYLPEWTKGNNAPEGITFVKADNSPTGEPLLIVSFEGSGTTAIYEINVPN